MASTQDKNAPRGAGPAAVGEEVVAPAALSLPTLLFLLHLMKADDGGGAGAAGKDQAKLQRATSGGGGGRGVREKRQHHPMKLQQRQPKGAGRHLKQPRGGQQRPTVVTSKQH
jgi:hypothetical protein